MCGSGTGPARPFPLQPHSAEFYFVALLVTANLTCDMCVYMPVIWKKKKQLFVLLELVIKSLRFAVELLLLPSIRYNTGCFTAEHLVLVAALC